MAKTTSIQESIAAEPPRNSAKKKSSETSDLFASTLQAVEHDPIRRAPAKPAAPRSESSDEKAVESRAARSDRRREPRRIENDATAPVRSPSKDVGDSTDEVATDLAAPPVDDAVPAAATGSKEDGDLEPKDGRLLPSGELATDITPPSMTTATPIDDGALEIDAELLSASDVAIAEIPTELEALPTPTVAPTTHPSASKAANDAGSDDDSAAAIDDTPKMEASAIEAEPRATGDDARGELPDPSAQDHASPREHSGPDAATIATHPAAKAEASGGTSASADFSATLRASSKTYESPDIDALMRRAEFSVKPGMSRLSLAVDPPEYGKMDLRFTLKKGRVTGEIIADSAEVAQRVRDDLGQWQKIFEKNGVHVDDLFVRTSTTDQGGRMDGQESRRPFQSSVSHAIGGLDESEAAPMPQAMRAPIVQGRGRLDLLV